MKKWNTGFRLQDNPSTFTDPMQRDFSSSGMLRADTTVNAASNLACPNAFPGMDRFDYIPCECFACSIRNRSIWIKVADRQTSPLMDVQTRVRYGVESRFGTVEDVNHTKQSSGSLHFIVRYSLSFFLSFWCNHLTINRFVSEVSVARALAHGGGRIEEKGIKLNISAMFRSKWVLLPSAFQMGNRPMPEDSIYRVVKAPTHRRGDLPPLQDLMMARGDPSSQRTPSGGPFMHNNRQFGQSEPYLGKKPRFSMNTDGGSRGQQPFHAFHPQAHFRGPPAEATSYQNAALVPRLFQQAQSITSQPENTIQSRPVAEEPIGKVPGAMLSAAVPRDGAPSKENIKPRVSLPEKPAALPAVATEQCQSQIAIDQKAYVAISGPPQAQNVPARTDKSPVRQTKKKRQAAQLRASNYENTRPMSEVSPPDLASSVAAAAAAAATASAQPPAKEKETRRPSLFTEDEIKGRKQAWDRIAVPLISPRKQSLTAEDALLSTKPGHDRAKSLPVAKLSRPAATATAADEKSVASAKIEPPMAKSAERCIKFDSDAGQSGCGDRVSSAASPSSPKKSGKPARKKKTKQDPESKMPAKKEHKL